MLKPTIIDETSGQEMDNYSTYCPKCGKTDIEKTQMTDADFDENGWFHLQGFKCNNPKCNNTWNNKIIVAKGGRKISFS